MIGLNEEMTFPGGNAPRQHSRASASRLEPNPQAVPKRWKLAVFALIRVHKSLILVQKRDTGEWSLPGGRTKRGESAEEALRREVLEETGLEALSLSLAGVLERSDKRQICLYFYMVPRCWSERRNGPLQSSCREISRVQRWPVESLPANLAPQAACVLTQKLSPWIKAFWIPQMTGNDEESTPARASTTISENCNL